MKKSGISEDIQMRRGKRILTMFLTLVLMSITIFIGSVKTVHATDTADKKDEELTEAERIQKEMDSIYKMKVESNEIENWPDGPGTYGEAAIVMEVGTGAILYAKNIDAAFYPASITKLLTALVAMENAQLSDEVRVTQASVDFLQWDDAAIGLKPGNVISLEQAMYALLLASANEAAHAIGESVGENAGYDYNWFIDQMNQKCEELGCVNSHFANTNGLHDDSHYTCARDMALISRELFQYPEIFTIMQTLQYTIPASGTVEEHTFQQYHQMLMPDHQNYYEYAVGGKTGYTDQALSTLVTMADNGDMQLVCVVLKTHGVHVYPDTRALFDYAYSNFHKISIAENEHSEDVGEILGTEESEGLAPENASAGYVVLPVNITFDQLEMKLIPDDETCQTSTQATLEYYYQGNYMGGARAELGESYIEAHTPEEEEAEAATPEEETVKTSSPINSKEEILKGCIVAWIILVILLIAILLLKRRRRRK